MSGIRRVSQLGTTGESTYVDGSIQTADIADGAITTAKIADGAIVTIDIANTAVTSDKLASSLGLTGSPTAPTASAGTNTTQLATTAFVTTADNLKANLASPTFTGLLSAAGITASGTVRGSGSIVQVVSANQGATDLQSAGYAGTVTMTPKFADSNILVWINYHAYKYNTTPAVNNYYQLRNVTAGTVIRENPYMVYSSPEYMFQGVISGIQSAGSTSSRQYGLLVDSSASARIYFYWSTTYAMEIAV